MSLSGEESFKMHIVKLLGQSGATVEKNPFPSKWRPDIVAVTADKSTILFEVRTFVTSPDILSAVSTAYSASGARTVMPVIISSRPTPKSLSDAANLNGVVVVTADQRTELESKVRFVVMLAEIESRLGKLSRAGGKQGVKQIVESLTDSGVLDRTLGQDILEVWKARNKLAHGDEGHGDFDPSFLDLAAKVLNSLPSGKHISDFGESN